MIHRRRFLTPLSVLLFLGFLTCAARAQQEPSEGRGTDTASVHADAEEHGGADAHDAHGTENLTPSQEMLRILEHKVENTPYIHEYPFPSIQLPRNWIVRLGGVTIDMSPTRHVVYMWFGALLTIVLSWLAVRQNARGTVPRGFGNMIESVIVFIRDEVAMPFLGKDTSRFLPILLTFFFFIGMMNLVGLVPFGATATGNINITAALALVTFGLMLWGGMRSNGLAGFWKGLVPHGIPGAIIPIMFVIEILGLLTKPFALAVRLFANMLSGGLVLGAFYALIFGLDSLFVAPVSLVFLLFMSMLKLFVSLLQAYIFTMLSSFFIGMSVHQSH